MYCTKYLHILTNILNAEITRISEFFDQLVNLEMYMFKYLPV